MSRPSPDILAERLEVVLAIGEANAERQRAQARLGAAQIETMRIEQDEDAGDAADHAEAGAADDAARAACEAADARIGALEDRLAALDRELDRAERQGEP